MSKETTDIALSGTTEIELEQQGFLARLLAQPQRAREGFQTLKAHLAEESEETKFMLDVYRRSVAGGATEAEKKEANDQFLDLLRLAGMATFCSVVPGSFVMLPLAVVGARKMGIRLLPSTFELDIPPADTPR